MSRRGLRDRWRDEHVIPHKEIGDACKVLLLILAGRMTDRGAVSVPRDQLAAMLDVDPRRITAGIGVAVRHRLLMKVGGGYRGRTAEYVAVIPTGKVAVERPPLSVHLSELKQARKVAGEHPPNTRVTKTNRKPNAHQRDDGVEREHDQTQRRSDEEVPTHSSLAAVSSTSGTQPEAGNPRCQVCDRPTLYHPKSIARGVCAACATHKEETAS